jgi:hypothetical protein
MASVEGEWDASYFQLIMAPGTDTVTTWFVATGMALAMALRTVCVCFFFPR